MLLFVFFAMWIWLGNHDIDSGVDRYDSRTLTPFSCAHLNKPHQ